MDKEHVVVFLENDPKNAYSYQEIADKLGERMKRTFTIHSVREAIRKLMKENPRRIVRHTAKRPWTTLTGNVVQQIVAYYAIKKKVVMGNDQSAGTISQTKEGENISAQPKVS